MHVYFSFGFKNVYFSNIVYLAFLDLIQAIEVMIINHDYHYDIQI